MQKGKWLPEEACERSWRKEQRSERQKEKRWGETIGMYMFKTMVVDKKASSADQCKETEEKQ